MRLRATLALLVLVMGFGLINDLPGCGDKFLVSSRGTRYQRSTAAHSSASILIYTNPASDVPKALANVAVSATLTRVGYRPTVVDNGVQFDAMLSRGGWDLVLVGMPDVEAVSKRVQNRAGILPVVLTAEALKQTRKQYPVVFKGPAKSDVFLEAIEDALSSRPKSSDKKAI